MAARAGAAAAPPLTGERLEKLESGLMSLGKLIACPIWCVWRGFAAQECPLCAGHVWRLFGEPSSTDCGPLFRPASVS